MCGIAGLINNRENSFIEINKKIRNMVQSLNHRGPDNSDIWVNDKKTIALGHSRLSILDLTKNGSQPMLSSSGRNIITYNGEIYNHQEIRRIISQNKNINWSSNTDTETLIESIELFGIDETLKKINGMFAFGVLDKYENKLYLVRDKIGEKPLYYTYSKNIFLFASELSAITSPNLFDVNYDINAINMFLKYQYVPSPYSIFNKIYKLQPGHLMSIDLKENFTDENIQIKQWWNLKKIINKSKSKEYDASKSIIGLNKAIENAVHSQMISDVPIGSFLSGGIDSTLVTSIMNKYSKNKLKTFTIGLKDKTYDESIYAKKIANFLQTEHNEYIIDENELLNNITNIIQSFDEPFADSSQIPTYLISKYAKEEVSVVLTGDGGDEFFGGYNRYLWSEPVLNILRVKPRIIRYLMGNLINISPELLNKFFFNIYKNLIDNKVNVQNLHNKLNKVAYRLKNIKDPNDLHISLVTEWNLSDDLFKNNLSIIDKSLNFQKIETLNEIENMMYNDSINYLPDDILYKVDRSSMQHSLETRAPLLDQSVIEKSWEIPFDLKINTKNKTGKNILKKILNNYIPKNLYERPKMGFSIPLSSWFRGKLKDFTYDTLLSQNLFIHDYFDKRIISKYLDEHLSNKKDWQYRLWSLIVLQIWSQKNKSVY